MQDADAAPSLTTLFITCCVELITAGALWIGNFIHPLALGLVGALLLVTYTTYRSGRRRALWLEPVLALLAVTGGYGFKSWQDRGSIADIRMTLAPDRIIGRAMLGHVVVKNNHATEPLKIVGYRIAVGSEGVEMQQKAAIEIAPGQTGSFPVSTGGHLADGGRVSFEGHYSFGSDDEASKAAYAEFNVSPRAPINVPIQPTECCERAQSDFKALDAGDSDKANGDEGRMSLYPPDADEQGKPLRLWDAHQRRVFIFDAAERWVGFYSILRGSWHGLKLPLSRTFDGKHDIIYRWHEPNGFMGLTVDGVDKALDVDTGHEIVTDRNGNVVNVSAGT